MIKILYDSHTINRSDGPERVIDVVDERAPNGLANLDEFASHAELEAIVKG